MIQFVWIWEFRLSPGSELEFERIYESGGDWERLMRMAPDFRSTELLRDVVEPVRYVTIDYSSSMAPHEKFMVDFATEYKALDEKCESLTDEEKPIGSYSLFKVDNTS